MIVWLINYCYGKVGCGFHVSKPWHRAEDPDFQHTPRIEQPYASNLTVFLTSIGLIDVTN